MNCRHASARAGLPGESAAVLLPLPLGRTYDYRIPAGMALAAGDIVVVPLAARQVTGVVWGPGEGDIEQEKLKNIIDLADAPPLTDELRRFIQWTASYTLAAPGAVLRMTMSVPSALKPPKPVTAYIAVEDGGCEAESGESPIIMTAARRRVLAALADGVSLRAADLARAAGVSAGVVRGLVDAGLVRAVPLIQEPRFAAPDCNRPGPALSPAQAAAAAALRQRVAAIANADGDAEGGGFSVSVLDGVTGSGKTEVYFEAVAAALEAGRQVLVLVPEIALTVEWLRRFEDRFATAPAEWHSELTALRRRHTWRAVATGEAPIVVGARSALFLPFAALGLIVVDEEHDSSFKQEDGVIYNARDMVVVRARIGGFPAVLVSATPSLETVVNCDAGRYARLLLPERHGGASLPDIRAVDMRSEDTARQSWISPTLRDALAATLAAGEQALLFLNRRGYAPLTLCRACGHRLACPQCTAWLVEHRLAGRLQCHHCGHGIAPPASCPECGAADSLAACGPGIERLAEEVAALHPEARIAVMASDTVRGPKAAAELLRRVREREVDILIGTQVVAKGHHFPLLTLVGVVDADLGLSGGDLRAAERTYQLLQQVAGRAGRADRPGRVLVQTYAPEHPVMRALVSGERDRFVAAEAAERRASGMPPFGKLAAVIVSGPDLEAVDAAGRALARTAPRGDGIEVFGPAPAPLAMLRGHHRHRLLLKARKDVKIQPVLRRWQRQIRVKSGVRVRIDIDPYSFL